MNHYINPYEKEYPMKIEVGEEVKDVVYNFPVTLDEEARALLVKSAKDKITFEELENLMIEWYMVKVVCEKAEEMVNSLPKEDK